MKTTPKMLAVSIFIILTLLSGNAEASRPVKTTYWRCQELLSELAEYTSKLKAADGVFPPLELRADPLTGEIPLEALVEQALIKDVEYHKLVYPGCRYAVAPWALTESGRKNARGHDIYCVKHGFIAEFCQSSAEEGVTAESLRKYFTEKCEQQGIDPKVWQKTLDAFNPDPNNLGGMNPVQRAMAGFATKYGPLPVLIFQLLIAISGAMLFLKRSGNWQVHFWAGVTAGASLWAGLQTVYLAAMLKLFEEARLVMVSRRSLGQIFAMQEVVCFFLFIYFIVMVFKFRKYQRPVGPVVAMVFATLPGIISNNIFTGLVGLLAFRSLLQQARNSE